MIIKLNTALTKNCSSLITQKFAAWFLLCFLISPHVFSQSHDFSDASIIQLDSENKILLKAAAVLQEEIEKRTNIKIPIHNNWNESYHAKIIIGVDQDSESLPDHIRNELNRVEKPGIEGYRLLSLEEGQTVLAIGSDPRGALYSVGKLLRELEMRIGHIVLPQKLSISSTPKYPIRGHQLGYRPKTNSYDAWSVKQFDQYIRELVIFGANSIEIMPPRTDDDLISRHMKLPSKEMMAAQSTICEAYGVDVWMWYPNMADDYSDPATIKDELEERHEVFGTLPRLDALFVPGGDPGDVEPDLLFNWLSQVAEVLQQYHPNAKIWVSPQVFRPSQEWFDAFYDHVNKEYNWFGGVVFGPWVKTPIKEIRETINSGIPIRRYPDITHSISCQYPIPEWDLAYAITLGRECINPRPMDQKEIHNAFDELAQGSISYSEGTNDDVNKFIWSAQDWNPETPAIETLREYARFFIGPDYSEAVAQGLVALENNLRGPLLINSRVQQTLKQWQDMESEASPQLLENYRFQMGLIRAYYDAYIQRRLYYETELEQKAREVLANAELVGSANALIEARKVIEQAWNNPVQQDLRQRCLDIADELFESIGAQLTIEKHGAMSGRGNFIDNIDLPLNDAAWILFQIDEIEKIEGEQEMLEAIDKALNRTNPGPGGFYDNFGSSNSWKRVISDKTWQEDPGSLLSPRVSFGVGLRGTEWVHEVTAKGLDGRVAPRAWMNQVTTLYEQPLKIVYENLNPDLSYTLKIAYTGRFPSKMKLIADDNFDMHGFIKTGTEPIYQFDVPREATADGKVVFSWSSGEGERGSQVAEIWLIVKK